MAKIAVKEPFPVAAILPFRILFHAFLKITCMMYRYVCIILLLLLTNPGIAATTVVTGDINGCNDVEVTIYPPIGSFINKFLLRQSNMVQTKNGKFSFSYEQQQPGFVVIESKCFKRLLLLMIPGDSVHIQTSVTADTPIRFTGSNAAGHYLYNNQQLLYNRKMENAEELQSAIIRSASPAIAITAVEAIIGKYQHPLDSVLQRKEITDTFYHYVRNDIISDVIFNLSNIILTNTDPGNSHKQDLRHSDKTLKDILVAAYTQYDPFNREYAHTISAFNNASNKSRLIENGTIQGPLIQLGLWDKQGGNYRAYNYAPPLYQELLKGDGLLLDMKFRFKKSIEMADALNQLKNIFPQSPYVPLVQEELASFADQPAASADGNTNLVFFDETQGKVTPVVPGTQFQNLEELIAKQFPGQAVFIDLWATWCSPCKAEFRYEPALHQFLKKKNITMLYVSMDFENYREEWKRFIREYKLNGFHYFPDKSFRETLEKTLQSSVIGIPRYLLFNKHAVLVAPNALRPSAGQQLYTQLEEKLQL